MLLPNGEQAIVPLEKLLDYCLNPDHPRGRHKARVFTDALGITAAEASLLQQALRAAARDLDATSMEADDFGDRFVIDFEMKGPGGTAVVRSLWIIRHGEVMPRLASCYVR
jgi:hypothetical protein